MSLAGAFICTFNHRCRRRLRFKGSPQILCFCLIFRSHLKENAHFFSVTVHCAVYIIILKPHYHQISFSARLKERSIIRTRDFFFFFALKSCLLVWIAAYRGSGSTVDVFIMSLILHLRRVNVQLHCML